MNEENLAAEEASEAIQSEENIQVESPTTEQTTGEVTEPAGEDTETVGKGASQRIRELNRRTKTAEAKAQSLEEKIAELTSSEETESVDTQFNPQEPIVKDGEEIDGNELNRRISDRDNRLLQTAEARFELKSKQNEAINRHRNETAEVLRDYPQLDPKSPEFDKELSETVTEAVEAKLKANPYNASVKGFVDKLMVPFNRAVAKAEGQVTENIAKQVSETALRPTSVRKSEKTAGDKTIAELEADLGIRYS